MRWLFWLLFLVGCTSLPRTLSPTADRSYFYPNGVYHHQVNIETMEKKLYTFKSVVKISAEKINVVGLSPFQTTVFSIDENRKTKEVKIVIHQSELEKYRDYITDFYDAMRIFLTQKRTQPGKTVKVFDKAGDGTLLEMGIPGKHGETRVKLVRFDDNGIADKIEISHTKFQVVIHVVGYEA